jgi:hypothetical protein
MSSVKYQGLGSVWPATSIWQPVQSVTAGHTNNNASFQLAMCFDFEQLIVVSPCQSWEGSNKGIRRTAGSPVSTVQPLSSA